MNAHLPADCRHAARTGASRSWHTKPSVDRILDMLRTSVNITGDLSAATCIARTENELVETEATSLA